MSGTWASLSESLAGVPRLPGAACAGRWDVFDPARDGEDVEDLKFRHSAAQRICVTECPCLADCRSWVESLKPSKRPVGVIAGEVWYMRFEKRSAA